MNQKSLLALLAAVSLMVCAPAALAQASRTWVSGVGDDANPCSRTAPCKTFAGAISKTAIGGEIDALDPGGFGGVTITKSITIDGGGGQIAGSLVTGTNGIIVNAAGATVVLRNIQINGTGNGIHGVSFLAGAALRLENVVIEDFASNGINMTSAGELLAQNSVIRNCATGVNVQPTSGQARATLDRLSISCTTGVAAQANSKVVLRDSTVSTATTGFNAIGGATATIDSSRIGFCTTAVNVDGAATLLRLTNATILDNTTGLAVSNSGQIISFNNNRLTGNTTDGSPTTTVYQR
ncbi:right-handed parallel beta-helix repeat-containing protein [soil metagenome]